ncbi:MAG: hypothetical protein HY908_08230 [Myxococcales bacterium]|nr:hypothetical protein [Myxococcales bacterium]
MRAKAKARSTVGRRVGAALAAVMGWWLASSLASGGCSKQTACRTSADCARSCSGTTIVGEACVDDACRAAEPYDCTEAYGPSYTCGVVPGDVSPRCVTGSCSSDDDCEDVCRDDAVLVDYGCDGELCGVVGYVPDGCTPGGGGSGGTGGTAGGGGAPGGSGGGGTGGASGGAGGAAAGAGGN